MTTRYTNKGKITLSGGVHALQRGYENLLLALCKSGCTLPKFSVTPTGSFSAVIDFTVEGTEDELAIFRREFSSE